LWPGRSDVIDRDRLAYLMDEERKKFAARNPRSRAAAQTADASHLFGGVPMTWMAKTAGGFPLYFASATGNRVVDLDGHELVDFCLGDTGAMAGHSPPAVVTAVVTRLAEAGGATTMLPTEDAAAVADELSRRFGPLQWSFSLTATDANRWAIRLSRAATGRPKILVHSWCYHGSVDETLIVTSAEGPIARPGNIGAPGDVTVTSRVAEYNDLDSLARELAHGDVAAVLMEPALTNVGIVLPETGYLEGVRTMTREAGVLLINDETHTFSAGPGGCTKAWSLEPDIVTVGKAIAGGIPAAAYGLSAPVADRLVSRHDLDLVDAGGVGGTLAGNALSLAAARATLCEVLTDSAFEAMIARSTRYHAGVDRIIAASELDWSVVQLGARSELCFMRPAPRNGTESQRATDIELEDYLHLYLVNRDILLTPFHNMALMCPTTTDADVDLHVEVLGSAVRALIDG
jgi:glutamate-1-semialdehyde 2,1-aminomutase